MEQKFQLIQQIIDKLAVQYQDANFRASHAKATSKAPPEVEPKTEKIVVLLVNFGFGEELKARLQETIQKTHAEYVE